jgi:hypothetical protein
MIDTSVHHNSIHPGRQLGILSETIERSIDLDEHVLRDVLGVVMVTGKLVRNPVHHRTVALDEHLEGRHVASSRAGDKVRIWRHHA